MIKITGYQVAYQWCVYTLTSDAGEIDFIWPSKIASALSLKDVLSNPQFDQNKPYIFNLYNIYKNKHDAQNAIGGYMQQYGMPPLNKTVRYNRYTPVQCNETGKVWRNARECALEMGINQGQLSQHLRRNPGYRSARGLTFSNVTAPRMSIQPPPPIPPAPLQAPPVQQPFPSMHNHFNSPNPPIWPPSMNN